MRAILLALLLMLAGCADSSSPASTPTTSAPAAPPEPADDYGSISGLVLTDEQLPIPGADVAVLGRPETAKSDAEGRFTFNGLVPDTYQLTVQKLGYETAGRKVEVRVGEVAEVQFVLKPYELVEPYVDLRNYNSYIRLGESFVDIASHEGGQANTFCESCHHYILLAPKPEAGLVEVAWTPSVHVAPVLNDDIFFLICKDFANGTATSYRCGGTGSSGTSAASGYLKNRQSQACCSDLGNSTLIRYDIHAGLSVAFELRVSSWLSFAYHAELPEGYTALPK